MQLYLLCEGFCSSRTKGTSVRWSGYLPWLSNADAAVGSVSGGPVQDLYFRGNPENAGLFDSIKAFNNTVHFLTALWIPPDSRPINPYRGLISDSGSVYFTHADLNIENIIILRSPNRITISGIVDWEQCCWYPEYWEYCKMHLGNPWDHEWCVSDYASRSVRSYNNELTAMVEY